MPIETRSVDAGAEWFSMIISYLKLKSLALWFHIHPESTYEQFELAWPFILDQMMYNAMRVAIEQLHTVGEFSLNMIFILASFS